MLRRHGITDQQWNAIKDFLPGKEGDPGPTAKNNRLFVNAVLWIAKTGTPWRDLPEEFGNWNSVFQRFSRWCKNGVLQSILEKLPDADLGVLLLDFTMNPRASARRRRRIINVIRHERTRHGSGFSLRDRWQRGRIHRNSSVGTALRDMSDLLPVLGRLRVF